MRGAQRSPWPPPCRCVQGWVARWHLSGRGFTVRPGAVGQLPRRVGSAATASASKTAPAGTCSVRRALAGFSRPFDASAAPAAHQRRSRLRHSDDRIWGACRRAAGVRMRSGAATQEPPKIFANFVFRAATPLFSLSRPRFFSMLCAHAKHTSFTMHVRPGKGELPLKTAKNDRFCRPSLRESTRCDYGSNASD